MTQMVLSVCILQAVNAGVIPLKTRAHPANGTTMPWTVVSPVNVRELRPAKSGQSSAQYHKTYLVFDIIAHTALRIRHTMKLTGQHVWESLNNHKCQVVVLPFSQQHPESQKRYEAVAEELNQIAFPSPLFVEPGTMRCPHCTHVPFHTEGELSNHLRDWHKPVEECPPVCDQRFKYTVMAESGFNLYTNLGRVELLYEPKPGDQFRFDEPSSDYKVYEVLEMFDAVIHARLAPVENLKCEDCGDSPFPTRLELEDHQSECATRAANQTSGNPTHEEMTEMHTCPGCKQVFEDMDILDSHIIQCQEYK